MMLFVLTLLFAQVLAADLRTLTRSMTDIGDIPELLDQAYRI